MPSYTHFDLIQERYPQPGCLKAYQALRLSVCGRSDSVDWAAFTAPDWDLLGEMAAKENLAPLLYHAWKTLGRPPGVPALLVARLGADFTRQQVRHVAIHTELFGRVEPALAKAGQKLVVLKGAALAETLYDLPTLRPMVDIDCLASRADLPVLVSLLEKLGYAQDREGLLIPGVAFFEYHLVMKRPGPPDFMLELHHDLIAARQESFRLDTDWFLSQTVPLTGSLLTLTPAAHLLHLVAHLLLHHGEGESDLLHFYDLHLLLTRWGGRIDWPALQPVAAGMNLDYAVYAALSGCAQRFDTPIPPEFSQPPSEQRAQAVQGFIEARRRPIPPTHTERYLKKLSGRPAGAQIILLWQAAFPHPQFMRQRYRLRPAWLWPLSYPLRWVIGFSHLAGMLLRRLRQ